MADAVDRHDHAGTARAGEPGLPGPVTVDTVVAGGWLLTMNPVVTAHARHAVAGWRAAWRIEAPTCGVRAYGLLFRANDCETEVQ